MTASGLELKIARLKAGLKQYELAAKLGISTTQLCEIETARRQPSPELAEKIKRVLQELQAEKQA
jgi:transcriptional regulator with XRE-family HTH domain